MSFKTKQTVACICGVTVGGQIGEHPTCIIPSIFYDNHKIVSDPKKGEFNRMQAETLINNAEVLSDKTGNPLFVDVMALTAEALVKYVTFVSEFTSVPFLVDSVSKEAKLQALLHIHKAGLTQRLIYNSINYLTSPQELDALHDFGVRSVIVLAFNPKKPLGGGEAVLQGSGSQPGLLKAVETVGIDNILVDTAALEVTSLSVAGRAIYAIKEKFGLPAGCAPSNAISMWRRLKTGEFGPDARRICLGASSLYTQMMGANFVIAGPIEYADAVFPACAMADAIIAAEAHNQGLPIDSNHPLYKIF
jgi:tetrahydromethanopterin S-methyltransferase subunit H